MKKLNKIVFIIISIAAFDILFGIGIHLLRDVQNQSNKSIENQYSPQDYTVETNKETGELILTNYQYGYKIHFPSNWSFDKIEDPNYVAFYDNVARAQEIDGELIQGMKIEIMVNNIKEPTILNEIVENEVQAAGEYLVSERELEVDGTSARELITHLLGYNIGTYFIKNGIFYVIIGYIGDYEKRGSYTQIYHDIISSLEFL